MSFKSPKQRAFYFAKKNKPTQAPLEGVSGNAQVKPMAPPAPTIQTTPTFKMPGLPKTNKFGRIKRNFKF
jgi:hypothetical protein